MKEKPKTKSDLCLINILVVSDTKLIKRACPDPSQDINKPKPIKSNGQYVFCGSSNGAINKKLTSKSNNNVTPAILKFWSTSIYQNSSDAVIIYQVKKLKGSRSKLPFVACVKTLDNAVQPDPHSASFDGLPALHVQQTFINCESSAPCCTGTEIYRICFALYTLADDGMTQNLYGYFYWDTKIKTDSEDLL